MSKKFTTGLVLISKERIRQINEEGFTNASDLNHRNEELAAMAAVYAAPIINRSYLKLPQTLWPTSVNPERYKPTPDDRIRELVKAGALIIAEIDRLLAISTDAL